MSLSPAALILTGCAMTYRRSSDTPKAGIKGTAMRRKCIIFLLTAMEHSRESVGTVERGAVPRQLNARSAKRRFTVATQMVAKGEIQAMVGQTRHAISVA